MLIKSFVLCEKVVDVFFLISQQKHLFRLDHLSIIGLMECGKTRNNYFQVNSGKLFKIK